ncbi:oxidoreductase [Kiloniella spongiae]|uniref:Oxidoreductase n=1 Tax=Kiloniella spongiae TaxID=1489064 RepID=A0A0H2MZC9_9PROT|nr:Gfo/Idh/MocA family oxidoreductase [Kiloniella spongiae]KLN62015.1 oxidoreductase [Kiloniella spongiae]
MLRWGILSTAKIGVEHVIPAILNADNAVIAAIASRDKSKADALAERFAIPHTFGSYDDLLASNLVDAVYIPLPTAHHVEWSIKTANAGKHVLCEKPISLKASQIAEIIQARDKNNVLVSEAFMITYHPQWHKIRDLIQGGAIGTLSHVQSAFTYFNKDSNNMRNIRELGGGALPDIGVYPTVATRFATGVEPVAVSAKVKYDKDFGTDVFASCRADFGDFEMTMYVATQLAHRQEISFHGDKGWIEVSAPFNAGLYDADKVTLHNTSHSEKQEFHFPGANQYKLQIEAFSRAVLTRTSADIAKVFTLENSQKNQRLIDTIYVAGESGLWENI